MKQETSFDDLIQAIQDAFLKVNNMSESQHLQKISEYFDADNKPRSFSIMYPVVNGEGKVENKPIDVPAICLLPMSSLKLDEVEVDFKVKLYGGVKIKSEQTKTSKDNIEDAGAPIKTQNSLKPSKQPAREEQGTFLGFFPQGYTRSNRDENYANIRLKFVSDEPPEGLMRIQEQYTKITL